MPRVAVLAVSNNANAFGLRQVLVTDGRTCWTGLASYLHVPKRGDVFSLADDVLAELTTVLNWESPAKVSAPLPVDVRAIVVDMFREWDATRYGRASHGEAGTELRGSG